ncbi:NAD(P)/FAD-dependent oxidoreductase [Azospirillum sp. SYSU D00513]|uniref:phytoene desaturase family protein n=1 Tax=Azospirillum sp. SYSU D00513 TaxID=2812561 RepID=UPI001A9722D8|nr:NAD(P)/FAD-dependent oxidoreductase [Azospirillum sp. SYSU D00513]
MTSHPTAGRDEHGWPTLFSLPWPRDEDRHHAVVVGAGIGGLTAGALLASRGCKVLVVEAHDRPGGYCSSWLRKVRGRDGRVGRFIFDAGVQDISGLGPRGPVRRLLAALGAERRIGWHRVRHRYLQDGLRLDIPDDPAELPGRLAALFPGEAEGIARFLSEIEAVYRDFYSDVDQTGGVPVPPETAEAMLAWPGRHPHAWRWMHQPYGAMLDGFLSDARLKHLLTTIAEYVTDQPERLSVGEMAPLFGYYFEGGFYPAGGSQKLADLLRAVIEENGGRVLLKTRADRILVEEGRAAGIVTAGGVAHRAPLVFANSDVVRTLSGLIEPAGLPRRYAQRVGSLRRGPSAILMSLAVHGLPDLPARVFLRTPEGLHFGIGNPSAVDPTLAPPDCAALTLLCLMSEEEAARWFGTERREYRARKEAFGDRLTEAAEQAVPGLRGRVLYRQVASPPTFARYALTENGNIYGAARGQWCPPVRSPMPGLMLVGAGCQNGPGVEAAVISGMRAANLVFPPG